MKKHQSLGVVIGLSIASGLWVMTPVQAGPGSRGDNRSYSNITGTNIWNSTAPILDRDVPIDPDLLARVKKLNADGEAKYKECIAAITAAEQAVPAIPPRQYLRRDPRVLYPQACTDLETLQAEATTLKTTIEEIQRKAASRSTGTW